MRKMYVWAILAGSLCGAYAQDKPAADDPVVMTVGGKNVPMSEFLFLAQKDSSVNLLDRKSLKNYVELFKVFKMKVADAESTGIQDSQQFEDELQNYQIQLRNSYLSDKEGEAAVIRKEYEREKEVVSLSQILFLLPRNTVLKDTVPVYEAAMKAWQRIAGGEDFTAVGKSLASDTVHEAAYEDIDYVLPMYSPKAFEDVVWTMQPGEISKPVRSALGFHIVRINRRIPNPGRIQVAQILIAAPANSAVKVEDDFLHDRAKEVYDKAVKGADFGELAKQYSADRRTAENGGVLPYFGLGDMVKQFEEAAFALKEPGDVSEPVKTRYGYHIIKLLGKKAMPSYEEMERNFYQSMRQGEWNFELFKSFDEREKAKFGYVFHQNAYNELLQICNDYFPTDSAFYNRASQLSGTLMELNGKSFPQKEFAEYLHRYPFSTKTCANDFMWEVYQLFVRDIYTEFEKRDMEVNNEEYKQLLQEYHDGILLFEISNRRIWSRPLEEQPTLEKEWLKELNGKYDAKVNWKALKKVKNYLKNK
ncbi:MAG: peptidylprolyl isomerase [Tannerella sp.]|jgi:peptidyl-prolyl cis-trans isomerase SurA|nr:peptidylprolyl isomerase [Tannerella sp.]